MELRKLFSLDDAYICCMIQFVQWNEFLLVGLIYGIEEINYVDDAYIFLLTWIFVYIIFF